MNSYRHIANSAALDIAAIIVFVSVGRRNHDEGITIDGVIATAAPFLLGLIVAWGVLRVWRAPTDVRLGAAVWAITLVAGMLLRKFAFGDGTATSFIIVAALFTAATLIGWRVIATLLERRTGAGSTA